MAAVVAGGASMEAVDRELLHLWVLYIRQTRSSALVIWSYVRGCDFGDDDNDDDNRDDKITILSGS